MENTELKVVINMDKETMVVRKGNKCQLKKVPKNVDSKAALFGADRTGGEVYIHFMVH
jgi:hypothetical protein